MRRIIWRFLALYGLLLTSHALGQGSLTPPGAPVPTQKTLDQIEPRTPISNLPFSISTPGSYYLTSNLAHSGVGITIASSQVTLDLMGFELTGNDGSGTGVFVSNARSNIVIRNGKLRGWHTGINAEAANYSRFEKLHVINCSTRGIRVGTFNVVTDCSAFFVASTSGNSAIGASGQSVFENCLVVSNSFYGISVGVGSTVQNCTAIGNGDTGIFAHSQCKILNNVANQNKYGIRAISTGNQVDSNHVVGNANLGIWMQSGGNLLVRNMATGNVLGNYVLAPGNQAGPIGDMTTGGDHPWANFEF